MSQPCRVFPFKHVGAHVRPLPSGIPVKKTAVQFTDIYSLSEWISPLLAAPLNRLSRSDRAQELSSRERRNKEC